MKELRNIVCTEDTLYMNRMKNLNLDIAKNNSNENLVWDKLDKSAWSRQAIKGFRIFDFWCHSKGCAIEVDGVEHDRDYDNYRDEYNFRRSGIVVLRVRNNNLTDLDDVLRVFESLDSLSNRKINLGIAGNTKESRRIISTLPYDKNNLSFVEYLTKYQHKPYWL